MGLDIRRNIILDDFSLQSAQEKRPFSTSALLRWFLKLIGTSDKEWQKLNREDEEIKVISDYIRPRLRNKLGLD